MTALVISRDLQIAATTFAAAAAPVGRLMVSRLADTDPDSIDQLAAAAAAGHPAVLVVDLGTPDPAVRLAIISPDQHLTQVAAVGQFPQSDARN
ncbi:TPA: hypothetical protein ACOEQV_000870 [Stenotrophomonas maltophilia]|uniref:hypothetical protein n=1 Tax=Stenotrophomonas maltophilia TaxID=40324 RepID=UPI0013DD7335|nr:hypothetical protein [Stenotrophomonas maltophilia]